MYELPTSETCDPSLCLASCRCDMNEVNSVKNATINMWLNDGVH